MLNLLRMDLHRFRSNKIMYVLLGLFCAFQIFGIFMIKQYSTSMGDSGASVEGMNESEFIQYMMSQPPSWMLIYITVFTIYFYMSEYNCGFHKNYMSMKNARKYSVVSKIMIQALFVCLMFVALILSDVIGRKIFFDNASMGDIGYLAKLLVGQFLLHWAFSILILCIAMMAKSILVSVTIGFILSFNVVGMGLSALESLVDDLHLSQYLLINTLVQSKDYNHFPDVMHTASVAFIGITCFAFMAIRYKTREDLHS